MCRGLKNKNYVNLTLRSNGTLNYIDYSFLHTLRSYGTIENLHNLRYFFEKFYSERFYLPTSDFKQYSPLVLIQFRIYLLQHQ
mgnify:CR=1 FL=1